MPDKINDEEYNVTDEKLVEAVKKGDDIAFQTLMRRYEDMIFNFVRQYANNNDDAEDITQDSFFKVWKNIRRFKKGKTFKPWLFTIARNTALDHVKKKKAFFFSELDDTDNDVNFADTLSDSEPLPDEIFSRAQSASAAVKILETLHPDYRTTLIMRYHQEMTFDEIAQVMNRPMNTVKSWHHRALSKLRELLTHPDKSSARITRQ
jgi:RNA polymerase sigma-70 factor (ECF subfamily)